MWNRFKCKQNWTNLRQALRHMNTVKKEQSFSIRQIQHFFHNHPLMANSLSLGSLFVAAELGQQTLNHFFKKSSSNSPNPNEYSKISYDWHMVRIYAIEGFFICSPVYRLWYKWLDTKFRGTSNKILIRKLLLDQFVFAPVSLVAFFVTMSILEGKSDIMKETKAKIVPTFILDCFYWLPVQTFNFKWVPPTYRVLFMGFSSFFWLNILCIIKNIENYLE